MNKIIMLSGIIVCLALVASCSYNKKELPEPVEEAVVTNPSGMEVTYTRQMQSIMDNHCATCHSSGGQFPPLTNYLEVKSQVDNGRILARAINGSPSPMPPSGLLTPQNLKDTIQIWIDQGALE